MTQLDLGQRPNTARFSPCGLYRYSLTREFGGERPLVICGLNPSKATADENDPTITKECGFARRWGFGRLIKVNAYGFIATDPKDMKAYARGGGDIVGSDNDLWIRDACETARTGSGTFLAAWGAHLNEDRANELLRIIIDSAGIRPVCLGRNKNGSPKHPLYIAYETPLEPYP